ncbi:Bifunctional inhibitor/plant lipid transfer protein/seed storage helical domain [Sesbania bispinosa]|nr:Bifunctional inhibitor/plant lipid transfer protein/seed storage helical domain [Sesbania bispinosa]
MAEAQTSIPSCAQELIPCGEYLTNSTNPPPSCCDPLKKTVENELTCLCNLFFSDALKTFNISVDQALKLSRNCGVTSDLTSCKHGSAPSPASVPPPGKKPFNIPNLFSVDELNFCSSYS